MSTTWKYWDDAGAHEWPSGTQLPDGAHLLQIDFMSQFVTAFNERSHVLNSVLIPPYTDGQAVGFFGPSGYAQLYYIQVYTIANLGFYCRNLNGPYFTWNGSLTPIVWTAAELFSQIGIAGANVRATTDGATFEYRAFKLGDIVGPWLFEDLREVMDRMVVTYRPCTETVSTYKYGYFHSYISASDAIAKAQSMYESSGGSDNVHQYSASASVTDVSTSYSSEFIAWENRSFTTFDATFDGGVPHADSLWGRPPPMSDGDAYYDFDGLGLEPGEIMAMATFPESHATSRSWAPPSLDSDSPFSIFTPTPTKTSVHYTTGIDMWSACYIAKWKFSQRSE